MAEIFDIDKSGISRHLRNIFDTVELDKNSVVANFATTGTDNKTYNVEQYSLAAVIAVGYMVPPYELVLNKSAASSNASRSACSADDFVARAGKVGSQLDYVQIIQPKKSLVSHLQPCHNHV